ncbi:MAG: system, glucose subfamily, subunit [Firmicutes bacterium]|nr:system, glucose subfamily, subunit [Bacillota bacterium]
MFGIFKSTVEVVAPMNGRVVNLTSVSDPVFAGKSVGDGVAIDEIEGDVAGSPIDGVVSLIFHTNHAFAVTAKDGVEMLVHIGIETVGLGAGVFERLVEEGKTVKAGEPIIHFDRTALERSGCSLITPVIITSMDKIAKIEGKHGIEVVAGKDTIFSYKLK